MSRTPTARVCLIAISALLLATRAHGQQPEIIITVYNRSHMRPATLLDAEEIAGHIIERAGLDILWVNCPLRDKSITECEQPASSTRLVLTIANQWRGTITEPGMLGLAVQSANGAGAYCYVFKQKLDELVSCAHISASRLLAAAMAHEIGHLLKGTNSHSPRGIMSARWDDPEIAAAGRNALNFTADDIAAIRATLSASSMLARYHGPRP